MVPRVHVQIHLTTPLLVHVGDVEPEAEDPTLVGNQHESVLVCFTVAEKQHLTAFGKGGLLQPGTTPKSP